MRFTYTVLLILMFLPGALFARMEAVVYNDAYVDKKTQKVALRKYPDVQLELCEESCLFY